MDSVSSPRWTRVCAVTPGERVLRGVGSVFVGAFALSMADNLWCAIPAGVCAVLLLVGAITGWCPTSVIPRRMEAVAENDLGIPDARDHIDLESVGAAPTGRMDRPAPAHNSEGRLEQ